ncbi:hypothetical protein AB833_23555 [Chromatiales bacterium (ex Bugula neritina AB1)]|nr:hypothetical protein AB833_23555 [Chromatiales bacterium (ex Bugula neritina AB1)]
MLRKKHSPKSIEISDSEISASLRSSFADRHQGKAPPLSRLILEFESDESISVVSRAEIVANRQAGHQSTVTQVSCVALRIDLPASVLQARPLLSAPLWP